MIEALTDRARNMRKFSTEHEERLWYFLRNRRLNGYKFHRQYIIAPYIVDFICRSKKLIIEADGSQHLENKQYDDERSHFLYAHGYRILRFWNNEIQENIQEVLEVILSALES